MTSSSTGCRAQTLRGPQLAALTRRVTERRPRSASPMILGFPPKMHRAERFGRRRRPALLKSLHQPHFSFAQ
jgi:hypothetical protein